MIRSLLIAGLAAALCGSVSAADPKSDTLRELVALERAQMDGWIKGDPAPSLKMLDPEATWFHSSAANSRLQGVAAVKTLFDAYQGMSLFDAYEIVQPAVQLHGDIAILTYYLGWRRGEGGMNYWNGTQVYQRQKEGWRILHTHWSEAKQAPPSAQAR
jgi:hypothetical protein